MADPPLVVGLKGRSYPIHLGHDLLERAGDLLRPYLRLDQALLVTDADLARTPHPERLRRALERAGTGVQIFEVPPGEASKSMTALASLLDGLLAAGLERRSTLIALGGGVVGDLGGFAAAVALRGVDYVQVPTTLLAQVDSAVGGKTGINSRLGKNLIGAFHQPKAVLIDLAVLDTLPAREMRAGYAEVLKYGCIKDAAFFAWLEANGAGVLARDPSALDHAVRRSLTIKAEVVAADERETSGERALLNFGHTFAHAYEALAGYGGRLLHGEAVALGMDRAAKLSARLGMASEKDAERIGNHLDAVGLPRRPVDLAGDGFDPDRLIEAMGRDKKVVDGRVGFVLLEAIGRARAGVPAPLDLVRRVLVED